MASESATRRDIHQTVTDQIITALECGTRPWHKPWSGGNVEGRIARPLRHNGVPYQGINILMLWGAAMDAGYSSPYWLTFKQAQEIGAHVRKGERGSMVVYASTFTKTGQDDGGDEIEATIPFLKSYTVFNAGQIEGLPAHYYAAALAPQPEAPFARIEAAERFFAAIGADVRHGGNRAFFSPTTDFVQLPPFEAFESAEAYYGTRAHEMGHWTGRDTRLDRQFGKRFGDNAYAFEELVAELAAAFLCADLGLTPEIMPDHAAYLASWLKVLKADKRAIFTAASQASKAVDLLHSYQHQAEDREAA